MVLIYFGQASLPAPTGKSDAAFSLKWGIAIDLLHPWKLVEFSGKIELLLFVHLFIYFLIFVFFYLCIYLLAYFLVKYNRPHPTLICYEAAVAQEEEKSFSNQKVASSIPCPSVLEQDTEPLIAPDVQCAISVNVKCVYIVYIVSRFG